MWKIDAWLVVFYSAVYIFRVIDSGNYANAAIINLENGTGIKKQLGFTASQWAWTQSIFSYSYLLFEPSNTILLKTFTPSRWMFILILFWYVFFRFSQPLELSYVAPSTLEGIYLRKANA